MLLLTSIQMFFNIETFLNKKSIRKDGYDFISVTKVISNDNMGKDNSFSSTDLKALQNDKSVEEVGPLIANQFRVKANAGGVVPFSTDLFLETLPRNFIDTIPPDFSWQIGQQSIPLIMSTDFLEIYNVFAPAQGLPQLSEKTISSVSIGLECTGNGKSMNFKANIVGLSDRINSILVPESFMLWANENLGDNKNAKPERIYIKTKDANDPKFLSFMESNSYKVNKDRTKFGRAKGILEGVITGLGIFGILVIGLAFLLFSFYLQLMMTKSKENLSLLVILGYSPNWISKKVAGNWTIYYSSIILSGLIITGGLNSLFNNYILKNTGFLSQMPSPYIFIIAACLLIFAVLGSQKLIKKNLLELSGVRK